MLEPNPTQPNPTQPVTELGIIKMVSKHNCVRYWSGLGVLASAGAIWQIYLEELNSLENPSVFCFVHCSRHFYVLGCSVHKAFCFLWFVSSGSHFSQVNEVSFKEFQWCF